MRSDTVIANTLNDGKDAQSMDPYLIGNIYNSLHRRNATERDLRRIDLPTQETFGRILKCPPRLARIADPLIPDYPIYAFKMNL